MERQVHQQNYSQLHAIPYNIFIYNETPGALPVSVSKGGLLQDLSWEEIRNAGDEGYR